MTLPVESGFFNLVSAFFVGASGFGCLYLLIACVAVLRFRHDGSKRAARPVPISILKPLQGTEPGLPLRLASFCEQAYGAPVQVICGVQDRADPAIEAVNRVAVSHPCQSIDLKIDARVHGCNRKISNLANMLELARHDAIVFADSDIEVGPYYLASVVAELQRPGVGAVTCLYHGVPATGRWSRYAALAVNIHFLPNVVTALSLGLTQPCFGSTIAMYRRTLTDIGGLLRFADCLADDNAIGKAVRSIGFDVAIPPFSVGHVCFENSLRDLMAHELRAARTIKNIDPIGYLGSIVAHPLPLALIGVLLGSDDALVLAAIALACRTVLCLCVEHAFGLGRQPYWLIPVRDLISFAVFVASYFGSTVTWRGFSYDVDADGRMLPDRTRTE